MFRTKATSEPIVPAFEVFKAPVLFHVQKVTPPGSQRKTWLRAPEMFHQKPEPMGDGSC